MKSLRQFQSLQNQQSLHMNNDMNKENNLDTTNYFNDFTDYCEHVKNNEKRDGVVHYAFLIPRKRSRCKLHGLC